MVEVPVIQERTNQLATSLEKLKRYQKMALEEFLKDGVA